MERYALGLCMLLIASRTYAIEGHFRVSDFGDGHQIWFEADFYDERVPDDDQYYRVVEKENAFFGEAVNRTSNSGGYVRYDFDLSATGGTGGTWYFWARLVNPGNTSDYMLIEGDPGDDFLPIDEDPIPGGDGSPPFDNGDDRIFEENIGSGEQFAWGRASHAEGHTKELQDGENSMFIFHRQGDNSVFWDVFLWTDDPNYVPTDGDYLAATVMGDGGGECPAEGDTHCLSLEIENPDGENVQQAQNNRPGIYRITVDDADESGDDGLYFVTLDNGMDPPTRTFGVSNEIEVRLIAGTWTISVTADDDIVCDDVAEDATCTAEPIEVVDIPDPCLTPAADDGAELVWAFHFGSRMLACPSPNDPDSEFVTVFQGSELELEYDEGRGWGYVPYNIDFGAGVGIFGPFDDSPNNRGVFSTECPEHLYNSFIGGKNFATNCDELVVGDREEPCEDGGVDPDGIIFRVDVPEGRYRFVGAFGDAENTHAHRVLAENGGEGGPADPREDFVVLVNTFDQSQYGIGETGSEPGDGVYARIGFSGRAPPPGDGVPPSPVFVNMDEFGEATDDCPNSPILEVTEGYIRIHQLQGNSNDGDGGVRDPNGGDAVILEIWKIPEEVVGASLKPGDVNGDAGFNIADPVAHLNSLFSGGALPECYVVPGSDPVELTRSGLAILDFNGDGGSNIADAVAALNFLFGGGAPPALGEACTLIEGECTADNCN